MGVSAVPLKLITPATTEPFAGSLIFNSTLQSTNGVGVGPPKVGVGGIGVRLVTGWLPSSGGGGALTAPAARVIVGANCGVGSGGRAPAVPRGVGETSGVAKMLGVGVGGLSREAGSVGAMELLT